MLTNYNVVSISNDYGPSIEIKSNSDNADYELLERASHMMRTSNDLDAAVQGIVDLNKEAPGSSLLTQLLAAICLKRPSTLDAALENALDSVRHAPESANAHYILGMVYYAMGNRHESVRELRNVVAMKFDRWDDSVKKKASSMLKKPDLRSVE